MKVTGLSVSASRHKAGEVTIIAAIKQETSDKVFESLGCNSYKITDAAALKLYKELKALVDPIKHKPVKERVKK